jgi:hypothetical protein
MRARVFYTYEHTFVVSLFTSHQDGSIYASTQTLSLRTRNLKTSHNRTLFWVTGNLSALPKRYPITREYRITWFKGITRFWKASSGNGYPLCSLCDTFVTLAQDELYGHGGAYDTNAASPPSSEARRLKFADEQVMFTECSLNVHWMFPEYVP